MKLEITQNPFMKFWSMAERVTGTKSTMATLASILCVADEKGVTLNSTDLKTTIRVKADGVTVLEPGTAILPLKVVGELFKKIPASTGLWKTLRKSCESAVGLREITLWTTVFPGHKPLFMWRLWILFHSLSRNSPQPFLRRFHGLVPLMHRFHRTYYFCF